MKKQALFIMSFILSSLVSSILEASPDTTQEKSLPSTVTIIKRVWANMKWEPFTMVGILRVRNERWPLSLKTKPYEMEYEFKTEDNSKKIRVTYDPQGSHVLTRSQDREPWGELPVDQWNQSILRTDLTYEELALDFLSWPKIEKVDVDSFKTEAAFVLDAFPVKKTSSFSKVRFWVSQQHYVLMRADFYNQNNQIAKRIEVNGVQKIGNVWVLKELQISTRFLDRDLSRSRTYLEIQKVVEDNIH
ncbi:MAG: outer membrane lipoprotein-sorting protein [Verrucomicrobiae bacterium]|nr:outer membrane lipoprotein-sorting protein [Verrucomicrobiae bacterium]